MSETYKCVDSVESFKEAFECVKKAQEEFATFSQEKLRNTPFPKLFPPNPEMKSVYTSPV